jgi:basic membrane protein A and related proteins
VIMLRRRGFRGLGMVLAFMLVAASCGEDKDEGDEATGSEEPATTDFTACQVTDEGGVDDRSFNQTAYEGLQEAADELGFEPVVLESSAESDYQPNVDTLVEQDCDLIVTVGFALGAATATAAEANTDQNFAIVDYDYSTEAGDSADEYDNINELTFSTDEAAFLAGYVAAATTESGIVGTYGGRPFPTVTIFMKGFEAGIDHFNEENDEDVQLIGWSTEEDDGLFTGDFEDQSKGRTTTDQLLDEGADIIMPVAGPVGLGSVEAVRARGNEAKLIWVDTDGCVSDEADCDLFLTSVMKNMDVAVRDATLAAADGKFKSGLYVGTLENDGVALAPFHEFDSDIPDDLKETIEDLKQQIIDGDLETMPSS